MAFPALIDEAVVSPSGGRIAFALVRAPSPPNPVVAWVEKRLPGLNPRATVLASLWVSRINGGDMREIGSMPVLCGDEGREGGIVVALLIDGSFVSSKEAPNDIDLVAVLRADHDIGGDLRPFQYMAIPHRSVKRRYDFDLFAARDGAVEYGEFVEFFQQVRGELPLRVGVVRIER
ncbi:MAG TPA: hypothetical protein VKT77_03110 [Chthonomonadaceae bacterium]|nr:hypothetical protein [Chthonomonadaceae bacterium]